MPGGGMNFELTDDQELIRRSVAELARKFDDQYWMEKDQEHEFPAEFYQAIADGLNNDRTKTPTAHRPRSKWRTGVVQAPGKWSAATVARLCRSESVKAAAGSPSWC